MPRRTWTDDDLRAAVTGAASWAQVIRRLGLADSGDVRGQLRVAASLAGIDVTDLELRRGRRWTDAQLAAAVAEATNLYGVFQALGMRVGGGAWIRMQDHIHRLGLDTSHWPAGPVTDPQGARPERPSWTDAEMLEAATDARSVRQVMGRLGLDPDRKRGRREVERRLRDVGIEPTSLSGQGWAAGTDRPTRRARPLADILVRGSTVGSSKLRQRLLREGVLQPRCASCHLDEWLGQAIPLQLDHIDGDRTNNLLVNLRLLCPTCHALTDTYCGRNIRRR